MGPFYVETLNPVISGRLHQWRIVFSVGVNRDFLPSSRCHIYIIFLLWLAVCSSVFWLGWLVFQHILERAFRYVISTFSTASLLAYASCDQVIPSSGLRLCHGLCLLTGHDCHSLHLQQCWPLAGWGMSDISEGSFCHSVVNCAFHKHNCRCLHAKWW